MPVPGKKHLILLITLIFFVFIGLGVGIQRSVMALEDIDDEFKQLEVIIGILTMIQEDYVDPDKTNTEDLVNGAIHGMMSKLDRYSVYFEKDEAKEFNDQTQGTFGGLGIHIEMVDGWLTVIEPLKGTPADEAGLMNGDRIVEIEGESTKGMNIYEAVKELKGEPGTTVTISIARKGEDELIEKTLTRAIINTNAVEENEKLMLDDTIGYIRLRDFTRDAAEELEEAIRDLQLEGMKGLILDLRYNAGGLLNVAVKVSELFIERDKVIVSHRRVNEEKGQVYHSKQKPVGDFLLAVLVNEFSASASEIVAGCVQDHSRGILVGPVGHKTFGKGSVQTLFDLKQGGALKLTTAKYYTPSGKSIEDIGGLTPDIFAQVTEIQRLQLRKLDKTGYIPPELLGKDKEEEQEKEDHPVSIEEVFEPEESEKENDDVYDIVLFTAYQCLKGAGQIMALNPGN